METIILKVDEFKPEQNIAEIEQAAGIIKTGGLVAFPTETVYGLGANALDPNAVKKIYEAKGRPSDNPLIAHISHISQLYPLVQEILPKAQSLIDAFWPGPLTLIFKKTSVIPMETSGGLDTVAVRFPENKVAQLLISRAGVPVAAPSANSSGKPSPTRASHVEYDLNGKIDAIIDGGHCEFGLESTIVDVSTDTPCLLRPGSITYGMLSKIVGKINIDKAVIEKLKEGEKPKAPGMKYTHYSPSANVTIVSGELSSVTEKINQLMAEDIKNGVKTGVIATVQTENMYSQGEILVIGDRQRPETIGANLFKMLRKCDFKAIEHVYVEGLEETELGLAIMNRLKKAAGYDILNV